MLERVKSGTGRLLITIVAALGIGAGVPLLWVWIGSKLQGNEDSTASSLDGTTAAAMVFGIIFTYLAILIAGAWAQARFGADPGPQRSVPRHPWNRSMRDTPYRPGEKKLTPLEAALVWTTIGTTAAFLAWFFLLAGSPLPQGG